VVSGGGFPGGEVVARRYGVRGQKKRSTLRAFGQLQMLFFGFRQEDHVRSEACEASGWRKKRSNAAGKSLKRSGCCPGKRGSQPSSPSQQSLFGVSARAGRWTLDASKSSSNDVRDSGVSSPCQLNRGAHKKARVLLRRREARRDNGERESLS